MNYKRLQLNLIHLNTVDSTNNYAANLIKRTKYVSGTVILTKRQLAGRGQRGNNWQSEAGENLTGTWMLRTELNPAKAFYLNIIASLSIWKTLNDLGIDAKIKWPNDIYVNDKKIAGILVENQIQIDKITTTIIGIGLNINQTKFEDADKITSIQLEKGRTCEIADVFFQVYGYIDFYLDHLMQGNFDLLLFAYYKHMYRIMEKHMFMANGVEFQGEILGINDFGRLKLKTKNSIETFDIKEIKFL